LGKARQQHTSGFLRHTRNVFLIGIITAIPLVVTFYVFRWLFEALDSVFQPVFKFFLGHSLPGAGLIAVIILVYVLGLIATNVIGRRLVHWLDAMMCRAPVIQYVYSAARQVMDALGRIQQVPFKKVVIVEFPKVGMYSLGFVTGKAFDCKGQEKVPVFIPHTPNPMTGFLVMLSAKDIFDTDMTIEDAMKMILSGGLLSPEAIGEPVTHYD
jgi:uncharacterized membrane protein